MTKEVELRPQLRELTHDSRFAFRGINADGEVCHLRIYQEAGHTPVVVASKVPENMNSSVTNNVEDQVPEVVA